jgi:site-specific DNA-cytosine methylase
MKVLSLFDGISGAYLAFKRAGIPITKYYASEIDRYAIKISNKNFPDIIRLGDVREVNSINVDILIAGFPCTSLSCAARQKESGLKKGESTLFWEAVRIFKTIKPKYFIFENVASMKKTDKETISKVLGVEPVLINSSLVSAQQRKRLYWCNFPVSQPSDKKIYLKNILESGYTEKEKSYCLTKTYAGACPKDYFLKGQRQLIFKDCTIKNNYLIEKEKTLVNEQQFLNKMKKYCRKLTPIECERLQTFPDNFTKGVSNTQRYKLLGNAFTVDVIAHILKEII